MADKDEPLNLIVVNGLNADQLRAQLERCPQFHGIPILPVGCEVTIVRLRPHWIEPDIEDEP